MGIPALEDGLFVILLIFDYLHIEFGAAGYCSVDREHMAIIKDQKSALEMAIQPS